MAKSIQWSGYVPPGMNYSTYNYRKGLCTEWQKHIFCSWYNHGRDIHGYGSAAHNRVYSGIYWDPYFYNFGNFYNFITQDPLFHAFCQDHTKYDIDKDIAGPREFSRKTVRIVLESENVTAANNHQIQSGQRSSVARSVNAGKGKPCEYNGVVYSSQRELADKNNMTPDQVSRLVKQGIIKRL